MQLYSSFVLSLWSILKRRPSLGEGKFLERVYLQLLLFPLYFGSAIAFDDVKDSNQWTRGIHQEGPAVYPLEQWGTMDLDACE